MSKIIVALDYVDEKTAEQDALNFVSQVTPDLCKLKVGKAMFTRLGPDFVKKLIDKGFDVFLDLKFHDIPQQVMGACKAAADLGVWMINVHASGGLHMMQAAKDGVNQSANKPLLIAVTVLTSLSLGDLTEVGLLTPIKEQVLRLARLAQDAGLDGVVCSAQEAKTLRCNFGDDFCLVTPGIRLEGIRLDDAEQDDQKRIVTPEVALENGSNYLVIGRPITQAKNPLEILHALQ